jgi:hypothetical protein
VPRLIRKTAILAKVETTYGTDSVPTGAANAILVSNARFSLAYNNVTRDFLRPYFGGGGQLAGTRFVECGFDVELANSGTAGTAPAWAPLLRSCGMAESVLSTPARVEYTPVSATFTSVTIYYHLDGVRRVALGCMGNVEIMLNEGGAPMLRFTMVGLDGGRTATADPAVTLTAFRTPQVVSDVNTGDINLGCTYSAGALSSGTTYPSRGLSINLNNTVSRKALLGGQAVQISNRDVQGQMQLDLTAAQEVSFLTDINSNTTTTLGFSHQTGAGVGILLHAPQAQRVDPSDQEYEGDVHMGLNLRFTPTTAGNDELRLVCL